MTCKSLNEFGEILGDKLYIQAVALASNLKKRSAISSLQDSEKENESDKDEYSGKKKVKKNSSKRAG